MKCSCLAPFYRLCFVGFLRVVLSVCLKPEKSAHLALFPAITLRIKRFQQFCYFFTKLGNRHIYTLIWLLNILFSILLIKEHCFYWAIRTVKIYSYIPFNIWDIIYTRLACWFHICQNSHKICHPLLINRSSSYITAYNRNRSQISQFWQNNRVCYFLWRTSGK
mgnify:CR=1 FL=1